MQACPVLNIEKMIKMSELNHNIFTQFVAVAKSYTSMQQGKVVVAGPSAAGKTCIINRIALDTFSSDIVATLTAAFTRKEYQHKDHTIALSIWDTAGQERFASISPIYFRGAQFALLVFDVTNQQSYDNVKYWYDQLKLRSGVNTSAYLVANKCDLKNERIVAKEVAEQFAAELKVKYIELSAKTGHGFAELLELIADDYINSE